MTDLTGRCLCGDVRLTVTACARLVSACHCSICRRWSGAVFFGFDAPAEAVTVEGPVAAYASSDFAERAWCGTCGSHLWFRETGRPYELAPGLFEAAAEFPLAREVYADRALRAARLGGPHDRVTGAEYERSHPFVEDTP